jgi:hypothetical protein
MLVSQMYSITLIILSEGEVKQSFVQGRKNAQSLVTEMGNIVPIDICRLTDNGFDSTPFILQIYSPTNPNTENDCSF